MCHSPLELAEQTTFTHDLNVNVNVTVGYYVVWLHHCARRAATGNAVAEIWRYERQGQQMEASYDRSRGVALMRYHLSHVNMRWSLSNGYMAPPSPWPFLIGPFVFVMETNSLETPDHT
ncbi:hypothetical protein J6590_030301 [Homalodisca vitripennis]|nr:hypothetical protein J6590_030301 [Homalodisca vitripennis]